jgi:glycosyltransferase involved in cell wall biosynthesis
MVFSVVVPVYNIEKWVEKCIDSMISQTYTDFELILVDDGSTDRSGEICDRYGEKYPFIRVLHKENGGLSDARNYGAQHATGEYLLFVDGDDFIAPNALEMLYHPIKAGKPDVVLAEGQYNVYADHTEEIKRFQKSEFENLTGKEALLCTSKIFPNWSAWGKAFRMSFWKTHEFSFQKGRLAEDLQLIDRVILEAESVAMVPSYYYYQFREDSIVHSVSPKLVLDELDNLDDWEQYFSRTALPETLEKQIRAMHALVLCHNVLGYMYVIDRDDRKSVQNRAKYYMKDLNCSTTIRCRGIYLFYKIFGMTMTCSVLGIIKRHKIKG